MDATITPNRALSPRGFSLLIGVLVALNLVLAIWLLGIGAFPVPIFLGIDVLALFVAFKVLFARQAGVRERVQVSADEIRVRWETPRGGRDLWRSPTGLTRVAVEKGERQETRVRLALSQKRMFVGQALSPKERAAFGEALKAAVAQARAERY